LVTHAVLSDQAVAKIMASAIKQITVTNSIEQVDLPSKFNVVDIAALMSDNLRKLIKN